MAMMAMPYETVVGGEFVLTLPSVFDKARDNVAANDMIEATVPLNFGSYRWQQHCRGLFQTPTAA